MTEVHRSGGVLPKMSLPFHSLTISSYRSHATMLILACDRRSFVRIAWLFDG